MVGACWLPPATPWPIGLSYWAFVGSNVSVNLTGASLLRDSISTTPSSIVGSGVGSELSSRTEFISRCGQTHRRGVDQTPTLVVAIPGGEPEDAEALVTELAKLVERDRVQFAGGSDSNQLLPEVLLIYVTATIIGIGIITAACDWLRSRRDSLLVVDARGPTVVITERSDIKGHRGSTILISNEGEQLVIKDPRGILNLDSVLQTAVSKSIEAAGELARDAGVSAELEAKDESLLGPRPGDPSPQF
jgi:hypothetical protein